MPVQPTPTTTTTTTTAARVDWAPVPRVNLLPGEILESRRFRRTQLLLALGVAGTLALGALGVLWVQQGVRSAEEELQAVQAQTGALRAEQAKYADVPRVLAQVDAARAAREQAMSTDVVWYRYLNDIALKIPSTVWLSSMTVTITADAAGSTSSTDPLAPAGLGTISFQGGASRYPDVATWLEAVDAVTGLDGGTLGATTLAEQTAGTSTNPDGPVTFTSSVVITSDAMSHRYDRKAG